MPPVAPLDQRPLSALDAVDDPAAKFARALERLQAGQPAEALPLLLEVLRVHAEHADSLNVAAIALAQMGRTDEAIVYFQRAAAAAPHSAEPRHNLGLLLHQVGRYDDASEAFARSLSLDGERAERWVDAGNSHLEAQRAAEALTAYDEALRRDPRCVSALSNRALALRLLLRLTEAEAACRASLEVAPDSVDAWSNLGMMLLEDDRLDAAAEALQRALALAPESAVVTANLIVLHLRTGRRTEALALAETLVARFPHSAEAWNGLAHVQMELGRFDEALASCERVLAEHPRDRTAPYNRAMVLLMRGEFAEGLEAYEARRRVTNQLVHIRAVPCPEWTGAPLHGETVLLTAEQGAGDLLQFIRYVPRVKAAGAGRVLVETQRGLASLIATAPGVDDIVLTDAPTPPCDLHVPILSLPRLFGTRLETIPSEVPYLSATARPIADLVRAASGLRVGFVWSGNPRQNRNHMRSVPCDALLAALSLPGVSLFSLQVGGTPSPAFDEAVRSGRVTDLAPHVRDFADTAAAVAACDVVVSVCTSVAHLAGALGRPTFTLLAAVADWRWLMDRTDSPWYPTMRLFRQAALDDWSAPLAAVREALRARCGDHGVALGEDAPRVEPAPGASRATAPTPSGATAAARSVATGSHAGAPFQRASALHAAGQADLALAAYDEVLRAAPAHAEALSNSAALLAQRGDAAEAERRFRAAIAANPRFAQAHHNLGLLLRAQGDGDGALAAFAQAVALAPQRAALWLDYANCASEFVHHDTALAAYDRALALEPRNATAMADRALALRGLMRRDEGIAACRAALRIDPRNAAAHANLALLLKEVRQWDEAEAAFHAGLAAIPDHPVMLANLSTLYLESGRGDEAMAVAERLVAAHPNDPEGYNGRGCVHFERGALDAAREEFERAQALDQANRNAEWNLTYLALLDGDLARGLRGFERRRSLNAFVFQAHERPGVEWDGSPLAGRTIFVHEEQGLGDVLQFVRYAAELKRRGAGRVIVETSADAARLVGSAPGVDEVVLRDQPPPAYDVFVPLMSLPYRCGTRLESIPGDTPYLRTEARPAAEMVRRAAGTLKVGLVWGGNPNHQRDRYRSVPFAALFAAVQSEGVALFSLQKGPHAAERPGWSTAAGLVDLAPHLQTLDDTASVIEALDLVITVDTAMAHLAGALGRPTWTLITRVPDWRWLRDRSDSPWYPSMRLFRQAAPDEWSRPLGEVRTALLALRGVTPRS